VKYKDKREDAPDVEPETETGPETVDEAVAVLPKASDVYGGDDFSGAKNSAVVNPAPGVWYSLPRNKPEMISAYEDRGYVRNPPGKNPVTGKLEPARTHGPMPGHVLMGCDMSIRDRDRGVIEKKNANIEAMLQGGAGGAGTDDAKQRGELDEPAVKVKRPG